MENILGFA